MMEMLVALMLAVAYGAVFLCIHNIESHREPRVNVPPRKPEGPWVRFNKVQFG